MSRIYSTFTGIASLAMLPSLSLAVPGTATDSITISEDTEVFTQLVLEGNGAANNWSVGSNVASIFGAGSFGEFSIGDGTNFAMVILPGANNALTITGSSRVEIGTAPLTFANATGTPLTLVDSISGNNAPNIHFKTTEGVWGIGGNADGFVFVDGNGGNSGVPFSIETGAPSWALHIDPAGQVGVGTPTPGANLHVKVDDGAYNLPFIVENTNGINFSGFRLQISPTSFIDFNNAGGKFRINADQVPGAEFEVLPNGNSLVSGSMTARSFIQSSDRSTKQDIVGVNRQAVLDKVIALPIAEWSYKADPTSRHIGPMAQDFFAAFRLGDTDKGLSTIDAGGVALAAIQGLKHEKDAQLAERDVQIAHLQTQLNQLRTEQEDRLMLLELALTEVLRNQSLEAQVVSVN